MTGKREDSRRADSRRYLCRWFRQAAIFCFWIFVWQFIAWRIDRPVFLVGPWETVQALLQLAGEWPFWQAAMVSLGRIGAGFGLAFLLGLLVGSLSYRFPFLEELLSPPVLLMKTVPVASFVILALIWAGAGRLSLVVSFLVVFPMIYLNTLAGLRAADRQLLEMAQVFRVPLLSRVRQIYRPALRPFLLSACQVALGMSWKSGIAAEVIGTPDHSIGEQLYMAKIFFDTENLFAWTAAVILLSFLFEKAVLLLLRRLM